MLMAMVLGVAMQVSQAPSPGLCRLLALSVEQLSDSETLQRGRYRTEAEAKAGEAWHQMLEQLAKGLNARFGTATPTRGDLDAADRLDTESMLGIARYCLEMPR